MTQEENLLRHTVATLAYRCSRALDGAPAEFGAFRVSPKTRTPCEILTHMGDLFDWALQLAEGKHAWRESPALEWSAAAARFFAALEAFDRRLASAEPLGCDAGKLFQGPIADALTHVGQIAMLRHVAGCKMRGENYFVAAIQVGAAGAEQAPPAREFD
jgi:hypothetical protein